jgi:hypothetical protein
MRLLTSGLLLSPYRAINGRCAAFVDLLRSIPASNDDFSLF